MYQTDEQKKENRNKLEDRKIDVVAKVAACIASKGSTITFNGKSIDEVDGEKIGWRWRIETEGTSSYCKSPTKIYAVVTQSRNRNQLFKQRKDGTLDVEKIANTLIDSAKSEKQSRQNTKNAEQLADQREVMNKSLMGKFPDFFEHGKFHAECGYNTREQLKMTISNLAESEWEQLFSLLAKNFGKLIAK